jgi:toxin CcdB
MARLGCYRNGDGFLLDVQTNLLMGFGTRLMVPLLPEEIVPPPTRRLHPVFSIDGRRYVMATHLMAAVPLRMLGRPVDNLDGHHDMIAAAIDMIFLGF